MEIGHSLFKGHSSNRIPYMVEPTFTQGLFKGALMGNEVSD